MRPEPAPTRTEAAVAVADLYRAHYRSVLRICRRYLRNDHEAEDAAQETFLAAHKSMLGGSTPDQPLAWLVAIARNTCWQRSQRLVGQPLTLVEPEEQADDRDALTGAVQADQRDKLLEAVGELPQRQQNAFVLCEVEGQSYAEAAARLAVTEPALEALLVRARRRLRQRLQPLAGSLQAAIALPSTLLSRFGLGADGGAVAGGAKAGMGAVAVKAAAATVSLALIGGGTLVAHTGFRHTAPQEAVAPIPRSAPHEGPGRPAVSREQPDEAAFVALHAPLRNGEGRRRRTAGLESEHRADGRGPLEPDDPTGAGRTSTPALPPATADDGGDPSVANTPAATGGDPPSSSSDPATGLPAPNNSANDSQSTDTTSAPVDPSPANDSQSIDPASSPDAASVAPDDTAAAN